jgi:hypothetical protein
VLNPASVNELSTKSPRNPSYTGTTAPVHQVTRIFLVCRGRDFLEVALYFQHVELGGAEHTVMDVEIELRIPTFTVKTEDDSPRRVDNSLVRFRKVIQVPAFPPPGSKIELTAGSSLAFECTIARADWHEHKQKFVLSCKYPKQRIFPHEYEALLNDPQWERTELPG